MQYAKLLGWGVLIYAVVYLFWSIATVYGVAEGLLPRIAGYALLFGITLYAANTLRFHSSFDILPYSLTWAATFALLDAVFGVQYAGWDIFLGWNIWVGYAAVVLVPLLSPRIRSWIALK